jgi:hypothetical protein
MNKLTASLLIAALGLFGCTSTKQPVAKPQPFFAAKVQQIQTGELDKYWMMAPVKPKMYSGKPKWLGSGQGMASYLATIDSNGTVVALELIDTKPKGWMTQAKLDMMPQHQYLVAPTNPNKTPVQVVMTVETKVSVQRL